MSVEVTIKGLRVPELEGRIDGLHNELASVRVLLSATIEAVKRLDEDVKLIVEAITDNAE